MADKEPVVGMGATLIYPSDRYPYKVVRVVSAKAIDVVRLTHDGPAQGSHNGFPVHDRIVDPAVAPVAPGWLEAPERARLGKRGWNITGTPLHVGVARYRRDWSD